MVIPDRWQLVKIKEGTGYFYKVFASWSGGYLTSDQWRLNSGIIAQTVKGDLIDFYGESGSVYRCRLGSEGVAGAANYGALNSLLMMYPDRVSVVAYKDIREDIPEKASFDD